MLFQLRRKDGGTFRSGTLIDASGETRNLAPDDIRFEPLRSADVAGRRIPVAWRIAVGLIGLDVRTEPLFDQAWMGTSVAYWEGPLAFAGSDTGVGYLEMTGY